MAEACAPRRSRYTPRQGALQARKQLEAVVGEMEAVLPRRGLAAAQLEYAQPPPIDRPIRLVLQLEDAIRNGELGLRAGLLRRVLADQNQHCVAVRDAAREVVDRAAKRNRIDHVMECLAAVDHDHRGPRLEALAENLCRDGIQPTPVRSHELCEVEELDTLAKRLRIEERKRLEVADQLFMRLRPGRVVEGSPLAGRIRKADLLRENGLPAARRTRNDHERSRREATAEDDIKPCRAGR